MISATGKPIPRFSKTGSATNRVSEGRTSQKMFQERFAIAATSRVSPYSHANASSETSGRDASKPPQNAPARRVSSVTPATTNAETITLTTYRVIGRQVTKKHGV